MKHREHFKVAEKTLATLQRFAFLPDEAPVLIEGSFVVAYHAMNGLMHRAGTLPEDQHINSPAHSPLVLDNLPDAVRPVWIAFEDLQTLRVAYVWSPGTAVDGARAQLERHWRIFRAACSS